MHPSLNGRSNWFKGVQLLCVYALVALFCYYLPDQVAAAHPQPAAMRRSAPP